MGYEVNPVKGTLMGLAPRDQNVAEMSEKCFSICSSFNQGQNDQNLTPAFERNGVVPVAPLFPSSWNSTEDCASQCNNLLNKQKILQFGDNSCDRQAPYRPVIWSEVPHYFPLLLKKLGDKEQALVVCNQMCEGNGNREPEQCKIHCRDEYNSVEGMSAGGDDGDMSKDISPDNVSSIAGYVLILVGACLLGAFIIKSRRNK